MESWVQPPSSSSQGKRVLLAGLDGAGKTRLAMSLSMPTAEAAFDVSNFSHSTRQNNGGPIVERPLASQWIAPSSSSSSSSKLGFSCTLLDTSGHSTLRHLWHSYILPPHAARNATSGEEASCEYDRDGIDAVIFVISCGDALRLHLALCELASLAEALHERGTPLLVVAAKHEEEGEEEDATAEDQHPLNINASDIKAIAASFVPLRNVAITDVDLRSSTCALGGCLAVAQWFAELWS